jgi:hypothetical protein
MRSRMRHLAAGSALIARGDPGGEGQPERPRPGVLIGRRNSGGTSGSSGALIGIATGASLAVDGGYAA